MELVEPPLPTRAPVTPEPPVGTSARWVPDDPVGPAGQPVQPDPIETPTAALGPDTDVRGATQTVQPPLVIAPETEIASPVAEIRKRNRKRSRTGLILSILGMVLTAGIGTAAFIYQPAKPDDETKEVVRNKEWEAEKKQLKAAAVAVKEVSPTNGEPIDLRYLPPGANIIVQLRPSEIWSDVDSRRELVFALGPLGKWLEDSIRSLSSFEPKEIEQLTIAVGLGPRESEPEISAVVRLHEAQQRSTFVRQRIDGQRDSEFTEAVYVGEHHSWLLIDEKTFAVGPKLLAADLVAASSYAADPSEDLRALASRTDRNRHVTVLVDTSALEIHTPTLFGESLQPMVVEFTDWLGKDVDGVAISMHFGETLFLETLVRNGTGSTAARLNRHLQSRVNELPSDILNMVQHMRPRRKGPRQILARFPAMTKAFSAATESGITDRMVQLTTLLPERAIPNLAVGTILAWDESTRTDFSRTRAPASSQPVTKLPETLAGRLETVIEVEFNNTPLQDAVTMMGEETGINFKLDGGGLKLASYTQNELQTFNLGRVPVREGIKKIMSKFPLMVLVADEATKTITITTKDAIAASGATAYELK